MCSRNFESGAKKRKVAAEKKARYEQIIQQTSRIDTLIIPVSLKQERPISTISIAIETNDPILEVANSQTTHLLNLEQESHPHDSLSRDLTEIALKENTVTTTNEQIISSSYETDLGLWQNISADMQSYFITRGNVECQHISDFTYSKQFYKDQYRYCTNSLFTRVHTLTSEKSNRTWLCYSPTTGNVYCFICKLLSSNQSEFTNGFHDWKNALRSIEIHEKSLSHITTSIAFIQRSRLIGCVDVVQEVQIKNEVKYWQSVLEGAVHVIKFLAERGMPFRGHDERFGSPTNGNYMGILEVLAKYDHFFATHIDKHGNPGRGKVSYLSSTICEELICLMGKRVLSVIVEQLKAAKYYCVSIDSTPDISHVDQLTIIVRYVMEDGPVERFLTFMPFESHTGKGLANVLLAFMEDIGIDIENCRGQTYDNASNMSGRYNGVKAHVERLNPFAKYVPCFAHSLNLVGRSAVDCCQAAVKYFCTVEKIYNFFSASTHRWAILINTLDANVPVPKQLSNTRWSCHADAIKALKMGFKNICTALEQIASNQDEKQITRLEALGIAKEFCMLEFGILTELWDTILPRFDKTSKALQSSSMDLNVAICLLSGLQEFVQSLKSEFDRFEESGKQLIGNGTYKEDITRKRKKKRQFDESLSEEVERSGRERFRTEVFMRIIDQLNTALVYRTTAYSDVCTKFGFLHTVTTIECSGLRSHCDHLVESYPNDIETSLGDEMVQFTSYASSQIDIFKKKTENSDCSSELIIYRMLIQHGLKDIFANVEIALRIYLCLMISNCTGERSFSKLKRIKNEARANMRQDRLSILSLMSIESNIVRELSFYDVIIEFANKKARKEHFI